MNLPLLASEAPILAAELNAVLRKTCPTCAHQTELALSALPPIAGAASAVAALASSANPLGAATAGLGALASAPLLGSVLGKGAPIAAAVAGALNASPLSSAMRLAFR